MQADSVVVLDGARVAEAGPPRELIASGGAFARLFQTEAPLTPARP
jgi:ABC-type multidrug transport system fused ATPase/permease subunit